MLGFLDDAISNAFCDHRRMEALKQKEQLAFEQRYWGCLKVCNIEQTTRCGFLYASPFFGVKTGRCRASLSPQELRQRSSGGAACSSLRGALSRTASFLEQIIGLALQVSPRERRSPSHAAGQNVG